MEQRKYIVIPVLICAFTLLFFVFKTDRHDIWSFSVLKNTFVSVYNGRNHNTTMSANHTIKGNKTLTVGIPVTRNNSAQIKIHTNVSSVSNKKSSSTYKILTGILKSKTIVSPSTTLKFSVSKKSAPLGSSSPTTATTMISSASTRSTTVHKTTKSSTPPAAVNSTTYVPKTKKGVDLKSKHYLCPKFIGGLGNNLFQFASTFGVAMSKNMDVIVAKDSELNRLFKLNVDIRSDANICRTFGSKTESINCGYDENLLKFNSSINLKLGQYLQSWKYFYDFRNELRKQLTFRDHIQSEANSTIKKILQKFNVDSKEKITLVGLHVRRGDMVNHSFGYNVATPEYLSKSVHYFKLKYNNVVFIVSTQDLPWTQKHMPNETRVEYISHPKREMIVATLALCHHTITTVGSFGWWIGWLTGGEVTYFKWPAKEGSGLRRQFSKDYSDFFYPGWIGM